MSEINQSDQEFACIPEMEEYMANFSTQRETFHTMNNEKGDLSQVESPTQVINLSQDNMSQMSSVQHTNNAIDPSSYYPLLSTYNHSSYPSYQFPTNTSFVSPLANQSYYSAILNSERQMNLRNRTVHASTNPVGNISGLVSSINDPTSDTVSITANRTNATGNSTTTTVETVLNATADADDSSCDIDGEQRATSSSSLVSGNDDDNELAAGHENSTNENKELTVEEEIDICVVSDTQWLTYIQESLKVLERNVKPSLKKNWNGLWDLATKVQLQWEEWKWYKAIRPNKSKGIKGANVGDLKNQIVRWILKERKLVYASDIPAKYFENPATAFENNKKHWYICKRKFLTYCHHNYKTDPKLLHDIEKAVPNDIIRIFGIVCSNFSRDDICKLTEAKAFSRSDLDGPLHFLDSIFSRWTKKFNDPGFELPIPTRAEFLSTFHELNPNDEKRINIERDYKWVKKTYRSTMKLYNNAMQRWKMETGGGAGAPENFAGKWDSRENLELFSHYGNNASCDYLAYILMYDKEVGYTLNAVNDPAPEHTVMENGLAGGDPNSNSNRKRTRAEERMAIQGKQIATMFGNVITSSIGPLLKSLSTKTSNESSNTTSSNEEEDSNSTYFLVNGMNQTMTLIQSLERQIESLKESIEGMSDELVETKTKRKRLDILNRMMDDSYDKLTKFEG